MANLFRSSQLTVPNDIAIMPAIQAYTRELALSLGFNRPDSEKILLALEEGVTNVIDHAFEPGEETTFDVILEPEMSGLRIIIKDRGLPFFPETMAEYTPIADIEGAPVVGLGSFLMKKSVDELSFHNLGREGKELHLVKHLPGRSIVDYHSQSELTPFPEPGEEQSTPVSEQNYTIRLLKASEVFEVSRLFYRAYGYSYAIDSIYYPDRFAELLEKGNIISVVTVTEDNQVAGHVALVRDDPSSRIAEAGMAVVRPDFRGRGCQNLMITRLVEEAKNVGLLGIYSKAVTVHVYAQKAGQKAGFRRCALVVGCNPMETQYKGIATKLSQRASLAYGYRTIADPPGITIYPPLHHRPFIETIYDSLGLHRTMGTTEETKRVMDAQGVSRIKTTIMATKNSATIDVEGYGNHIVNEMKQILRDLCLKKVEHITLFLNLEDPLTGLLCEEFERLGFFMAGVLPFFHGGDALILQYLNNVSIDYSKISVGSEALEKILAYIRSLDPNLR